MKCSTAVCAAFLALLAAACERSTSLQGDGSPPSEKGADAKAPALSTEDEVVDFLTTREVLQHSIPASKLTPDFSDWLSLGVNEPLDQRLALAHVSNFGGDLLKDKATFDGLYKDSVLSGLRVGIIGCKWATQLLRDDTEFSKNTLTAADQVLASEVVRKNVASTADMTNKVINAELAGYAARTIVILKKGAPPEMAETHAALRRAIRKALAEHPKLAESLKQKIKLAADVRPSHERVGKMIRAAAGG